MSLPVNGQLTFQAWFDVVRGWKFNDIEESLAGNFKCSPCIKYKPRERIAAFLRTRTTPGNVCFLDLQVVAELREIAEVLATRAPILYSAAREPHRKARR
jgi:hypothetical protein